MVLALQFVAEDGALRSRALSAHARSARFGRCGEWLTQPAIARGVNGPDRGAADECRATASVRRGPGVNDLRRLAMLVALVVSSRRIQNTADDNGRYCARSTAAGSRRAALRAGSHAASAVDTSSTISTIVSVRGSRAST